MTGRTCDSNRPSQLHSDTHGTCCTFSSQLETPNECRPTPAPPSPTIRGPSGGIVKRTLVVVPTCVVRCLCWKINQTPLDTGDAILFHDIPQLLSICTCAVHRWQA